MRTKQEILKEIRDLETEKDSKFFETSVSNLNDFRTEDGEEWCNIPELCQDEIVEEI